MTCKECWNCVRRNKRPYCLMEQQEIPEHVLGWDFSQMCVGFRAKTKYRYLEKIENDGCSNCKYWDKAGEICMHPYHAFCDHCSLWWPEEDNEP